MATKLFINISEKPFTGFWNGKPRTFKPGSQTPLPAYLAEHFAKHLTNDMLHAKGLDNCTSPKKPEQVPQFLELFDQACKKLDDAEQDDADVDTQVDLAGRSATETGEEPHVLPPPADDEEEEFEGLKDEEPEPPKPAKKAKK